MRINRIIFNFLIQGCFLALIAILSPFGFYSDSTQPTTQPTRTELVEQHHFRSQAVSFPDFQSKTIFSEWVIPINDYSGKLLRLEQEVLELLKQASTIPMESPDYYYKTTDSTSSDDGPLSESSFA